MNRETLYQGFIVLAMVGVIIIGTLAIGNAAQKRQATTHCDHMHIDQFMVTMKQNTVIHKQWTEAGYQVTMLVKSPHGERFDTLNTYYVLATPGYKCDQLHVVLESRNFTNVGK